MPTDEGWQIFRDDLQQQLSLMWPAHHSTCRITIEFLRHQLFSDLIPPASGKNGEVLFSIHHSQIHK